MRFLLKILPLAFLLATAFTTLALANGPKFCHAKKNPNLCVLLEDETTRTVSIPADEVITVGNLEVPLGKRITGPGIINRAATSKYGLIISGTRRVIYGFSPTGSKSTETTNSRRASTIIEGVFFSDYVPCEKMEPIFEECQPVELISFSFSQSCTILVRSGLAAFKTTTPHHDPGALIIRNNEFLDRSLKRQAICTGHQEGNQPSLHEPPQNKEYVSDRTAEGRFINLKISGNTFWGHVRHLVLNNLEHLTIQDNDFARSAGSSITMPSNISHALVDGNQFIDIGFPGTGGGQSADAIDTHWSGDQLTISNNIIRRVRVHGLDIKNASWSEESPIKFSPGGVVGNYINFSTGRSGSRGVIISGNNISEARHSAIHIVAVSAPDSEKLSFARLGHPNHSLIISDNILNNNNTHCTAGGAIRVHASTLRYVTLTGNSVTNTCGSGIEVDAVNKPVANLDSTTKGYERLDKIVGVRIDGNFVINNGRWCAYEEPVDPSFPFEGNRFEVFSQFKAFSQFIKQTDPAIADSPQDLQRQFEQNYCQLMERRSNGANSFGISVRGVHGTQITNNMVGNDINLFNKLFPQGIIRTYSDLPIRVIAPSHTSNAAIQPNVASSAILSLSDRYKKQLIQVSNNTVFCGIFGSSLPRTLPESISVAPGPVDASNRMHPTIECPERHRGNP